MKIRKATKKDFKEIFKLMQKEYLKHYKEKWSEKNALKTISYYSKIGKIFVAEIDKKVVGFIIIREEYYNEGKRMMVEEFVVNGNYQGKGIGKQLMTFVEDYCKKNKIISIWLITNKKAAAFQFYKKIGYKLLDDTAYFEKVLK